MTEPFHPDAATRAQIAAADPAGSVWLAANAGSGKTRVLTDRVAWLLLDGTAPERILCLTYTKAAAGEMQNRLFKRLGEWSMLSDDDLRKQITHLGAARGTVSSEQLRRARTLFAQAIETPGGLKIQTIHAFCASLLRRFPLEAGVTPNFQEMDEIAAARLHSDVLDDMARNPDFAPLVDAMARHLTDGEPSTFLAEVTKAKSLAEHPLDEAELRAALGLDDRTPAQLRDDAMGVDILDLLGPVAEATARSDKTTMVDRAALLKQAIMADDETRFDLLCKAFLTKQGAPFRNPLVKDVKEALGEAVVEAVSELATRLAEARMRLNAEDALARSHALHRFGPAFANEVARRKQARGLLDFDDQIARARHLLTNATMAQWVLFKLDGGLDHILVDEAQDTSPEQWDVIRRLAEEFGAGEGARPEAHRTLFVVGDRKQSIYRFQGADLTAFDRMRQVFGEKLAGAAPLRDHALRYSFRSSPTILSLVDAAFADDTGPLGGAPEHVAFFDDLPGRVDLWPVPDATAEKAEREWHDPVDMPAQNDPQIELARQVADAIKRMIADRVPVGRGDARHAVQAGDVLILLQRRNDLFHHIVRACKAKGLDLAGADRLRILDDLAVRDLLAALSWAANPDDDLALATVLRSPLGSTAEDGLFALAHGRQGRLWHALQDAGSDPVAQPMLADILRGADRLRPYELLQRVLVRHDGRRRLLARLGQESAEAIDALLTKALDYERLETPSLTGFLGWLESADLELKRQAGEGTIRVMTVHGAKGLEAPVVILPDTGLRKKRTPTGVARMEDGLPVWLPNAESRTPALQDVVDREQAEDAAERDRLLYVAMTRAESWLIVCAAGDLGKEPADSWYGRVKAAMEAQGAVPMPNGDGLRIETGDWAPLPVEGAMSHRDVALPDWLEAKAPPPPRPASRIAPSGLPGAKALPGEDADAGDVEGALRRGTAIHALLEHLPELAEDQWDDAAQAILSRRGMMGAEDDARALMAEARAVLGAPDLAHIFAPGTLAELPFALPADGARPAIHGTLDRVLVTPEKVTIVDYKTNMIVPETPQATPEGLLRQMAAYLLAAQAIWPGRTVTLAILWTKGPTLMALPHDLVQAAWQSAPPIDPVAPPA